MMKFPFEQKGLDLIKTIPRDQWANYTLHVSENVARYLLDQSLPNDSMKLDRYVQLAKPVATFNAQRFRFFSDICAVADATLPDDTMELRKENHD